MYDHGQSDFFQVHEAICIVKIFIIKLGCTSFLIKHLSL